jgi:hypothetical protein
MTPEQVALDRDRLRGAIKSNVRASAVLQHLGDLPQTAAGARLSRSGPSG